MWDTKSWFSCQSCQQVGKGGGTGDVFLLLKRMSIVLGLIGENECFLTMRLNGGHHHEFSGAVGLVRWAIFGEPDMEIRSLSGKEFPKSTATYCY